MRKYHLSLLLLFGFVLSATSCSSDELTFEKGDLCVQVEPGEDWLHAYPLPLGFKKMNPPQCAIWIEDTCGHYISTVFVTRKIATQGWVSSGGSRRKEALPYWCYQRGICYEDGLFLPTRKRPATDGLTGASPSAAFSVKLHPLTAEKIWVIKAEFNHSLDFNAHYPESASPGDSLYSGGNAGSGQPAVVYSGVLKPGEATVVLCYAGHSSPDGSDGLLRRDSAGLTTALHIVRTVRIIRH